jgi:hypothetical protein
MVFLLGCDEPELPATYFSPCYFLLLTQFLVINSIFLIISRGISLLMLFCLFCFFSS